MYIKIFRSATKKYKRAEEYLKYLKIAVERNSDEAFMTLHHLFPEGMTPEEYYDYAIKKTNNN